MAASQEETRTELQQMGETHERAGNPLVYNRSRWPHPFDHFRHGTLPSRTRRDAGRVYVSKIAPHGPARQILTILSAVVMSSARFVCVSSTSSWASSTADMIMSSG